MDSSEDSFGFAWTDASNSSKSESMLDEIMAEQVKQETQTGNHSLNEEEIIEKKPKTKKRKLKKELHSDSDEVYHHKSKKLKIESDSDVVIHKRNSNDNYVNDNNHEELEDTSYLDMRVKLEEQHSDLTSTHKKKKKKFHIASDVERDNCNENVNNNANESTGFYDQDNEYTTIKKKKSKKHNGCVIDDDIKLDVQDMFSAEDTEVESNVYIEKKESKRKIKRKNKDFNELSNKSNMSTETSNHYDQERQSSSDQCIEANLNTGAPRISDRITYEDDEEVENYEQNSFSQSYKGQQFLSANRDLKLIPAKCDDDTIITSDDEVWLVKCPQEVDTISFRNINITLDTKCKIKLEGQTYDGQLDNSNQLTLLLTTSNKHIIKDINFKGQIMFRKRIPKANCATDTIAVSNNNHFIPLPDTKCRHPLFGANYKKAIKLPPTVGDRLKYDQCEIQPKQEKKKKKKKKHEAKQEVLESVIIGSPKKSVKWDSEQAIQDNLFNF